MQAARFQHCWGTRSHVLQPKILQVASETWRSQINKYIFLKKIISGNSSLSGPGPLSRLFESVQEEVSVLLESVGSGLPSAQNNPLAKEAYFGVGYSPQVAILIPTSHSSPRAP